MNRYDRTRALVEGNPALAHAFVCEVEDNLGAQVIEVLDEPREELVMVKVRETAQGSLFYLGEALMTSCRVMVEGAVGRGMILGSDRCRAYELAVADAMLSNQGNAVFTQRWEAALEEELARIDAQEACDARRAASTKVDFSTMQVEE